MADVVEHTQLINMIERAYPELNDAKCKQVYQNILKCVEKKEYVRILLVNT